MGPLESRSRLESGLSKANRPVTTSLQDGLGRFITTKCLTAYGRNVTIYDDIGGAPAVAATVELFYDKVLADPGLSRYFTSTDMAKLREHQRQFVAAALGAPGRYEGRDMAEAHAGLAIDRAAFDAVVEHLASALAELGVSNAHIAAIAERLAPLAGEIVQA